MKEASWPPEKIKEAEECFQKRIELKQQSYFQKQALLVALQKGHDEVINLDNEDELEEDAEKVEGVKEAEKPLSKNSNRQQEKSAEVAHYEQVYNTERN